MNRFLFYGLPGVGKSTFAKIIGKNHRLQHISMGDVLRAEVASGSALGSTLRDTIARGGLVEDRICTNLLDAPFQEALDAGEGFILDGYPRSVDQIEVFFSSTAPEHLPQRAIHITMDRDVATEKLLGRRHCASCGKSFNNADVRRDGFDMPPILPSADVCPNNRAPKECMADLIKRDDDTVETIRERFSVYDEQTEPVLAYFAGRGMLKDFNVTKGIAEMDNLYSEMVQQEDTQTG